MRLIAIGGEPASGKSTIVQALLASLWLGEGFKASTLVGTAFQRERLYVLGRYDGSAFPGTDRLSMAVQPVAEAWLDMASRETPNWTVLFEGDRLFNISFLTQAARVADVQVVHVEASPETLARRHAERRDSQPEHFIKRQRTKVRRVLEAFPPRLVIKNEGTAEEAAARLKKLVVADA